MSMECGLGFRDLVHNYSHFITSELHNFGSALYVDELKAHLIWTCRYRDMNTDLCKDRKIKLLLWSEPWKLVLTGFVHPLIFSADMANWEYSQNTP